MSKPKALVISHMSITPVQPNFIATKGVHHVVRALPMYTEEFISPATKDALPKRSKCETAMVVYIKFMA